MALHDANRDRGFRGDGARSDASVHVERLRLLDTPRFGKTLLEIFAVALDFLNCTIEKRGGVTRRKLSRRIGFGGVHNPWIVAQCGIDVVQISKWQIVFATHRRRALLPRGEPSIVANTDGR